MRPAHFVHTLQAAPGQGKGPDDLIQAVYQPVIVSKLPKPYINVRSESKLYVLPPQWDAAKYLANSTGSGKPARRGSAGFSYLSVLQYSSKAGAPERAVAQHIDKAFRDPKSTKPENPKKSVPGYDVNRPLHRTNDAKRKNDNRRKSISQCVKYWGKGYSQGKKFDCDEFPFASTYEGAAQRDYDNSAMENNFSVLPIPSKENQAGGTLLQSFYAKHRILNGTDDAFVVRIN
ncbi:hypothetical protein FRZ00_06025 [Streptomyces mobaraensis]|uniref:Deoxyribonuclease NucA/NucB domain-containing protein n=2 Tax=Streptomyces mobaraensis TaxID=35621 RepID=A0A5N5WEJ1_STRMB|nr:hypothetical protein FRZ00_06025 [Streptomyces mobaraensis]